MTVLEHAHAQDFTVNSTPYRKLKKFSYSILSQLFVAKYSSKPQLKHQAILEAILNLILTLQIVSLAWYPDLNISNWSTFLSFLRILGYISYDSICADLGIMNLCFGATAFAIYAEFVFLFIFGIFAYLNKNLPKILTFIPIKIAHIFTSIGIIPSFMIMLMVFKYSIINAEYIEEYDNGISAKDFNYGTFGIVFSLFSMILLLCINFLYEFFICDMKHSHHNLNIKARSSSELDLQRKAFYIVMCIFYVSFGKDNVSGLQISAFIISFGLMVKSIYVLQYFNVVENCIQIYKMAAISMTLLIFLFGEILDNTKIIIVFNIILQPIVAYFTIKFVAYKYKKLKENSENPRNQFEFERKFRHLFTRSHDLDADKSLNLFTDYWNARQFKKNKLFLIWEFDVCISILKDERLARVKFSKISKAEFSLEGDIQEWKIFTWLKNGDRHKFSDTSFMEFLLKFSKIKKKDEAICNILIQLCNEFNSRQPRIKKLINLVYKTGDNIGNITENYKKLTEKYKSAESYDHYASFLENIVSNIEEANLIHRKKNVLNINNFHGEYQNLENYGKDVGVLLVSCSEEAFGTICYINDKASQILKTSIVNALGIPLANFIPHPFGRLHDMLMKNFLKESTRVDIPSHRTLCLQANDGFLIECYTMINLTAFYDSAYFLVSFKPRSTTRQVAIISEENIIINSSEFFGHYLGSTAKNLRNIPLSDIIPRIYITKMQDYEPVVRNVNNQCLALVRIKKIIKTVSFYFLIVVHNDDEIRRWQLGEDEDQLQNFYIENANNSAQYKSLGNLNSFILSSYETSPKKHDKETDTLAQNSFLPLSEEKKSENQFESTSKRSSSRSSSNINSNHAKKLLFLSKRKIWMLQWALLIVIFTVIITMVAVLSYIISDVSHTSKMSSLGDLGKLLYDYETITDWSRTIDKQVKANSTSTQAQKVININYFLSIVSDLEVIQNVLLDHFRDWSFCDSSKIISKEIIPTWNFNTNTPTIEKVNLYNGISNFIAEVSYI
ncbi:unnamed protein product [Blepharisma stoltei]|uniref:TmcB/TmcC TPR repeats domain-containing protein n=1 Tax=Blepharisma stoltei TaxID=1481888 RepID=A0AAU9JF40_9CILI|nr:unnamed protein product [Blepharisma stoltei]